MSGTRDIVIGLNAVIIAVTEGVPRVLTVEAHNPDQASLRALPYGLLDADKDRTLELGLRNWVRQQTDLELGYVEQLYTFADRDRDRDRVDVGRGPRQVSVAYLALMREVEGEAGEDSEWMDVYSSFPWEDWRDGRAPAIDAIQEGLREWEAASTSADEEALRRERIELAFGLGGAGWDGYQVLERYELLYEIGLVREVTYSREVDDAGIAPAFLGEAMTLDHRRILATALSRVRGKIKYRPVIFELMPPLFTLLQLQRVVEALAGVPLHKQNFRRLVEKGGLVEGTGRFDPMTGGRPAELFRYRREVLRERVAPGLGVPSPQPLR